MKRSVVSSMTATTLIPLALLAACGQSATSAPATSSGTPSNVTVTEKEFSIDVAKTSLPAGPVTFDITNAGTTGHDLVVNGPGVSDVASSVVAPGASTTVQVTLQPGTYELYCNIPGHKDKGMDATVTVT